MQERHIYRDQYFQEQTRTLKNFIFPLIHKHKPVTEDKAVLEIGCGDGGNLIPFLDVGCQRIVGIDRNQNSLARAKQFLGEHPNYENLEFILSDIYEVKDLGQFDIIFMKDTLEHIHNQEQFLGFIRQFLKSDGILFEGFPPWYNPFGGHQQMLKSKVLSKVPYFHILPTPIYKAIMKAFGEGEGKVNHLLDIKETGITIEQFESIIKRNGYQIEERNLYLINPNYETKFGVKPRRQSPIIENIPYVRNFLTTTNYYVLSKAD